MEYLIQPNPKELYNEEIKDNNDSLHIKKLSINKAPKRSEKALNNTEENHDEESNEEEKCLPTADTGRPTSLQDAAKGCILGAFIGDAAGAPLEFIEREITDDEVDQALAFEGGGVHEVEPGQVTDDSEMALALLRGLLRSGYGSVNQLAIAEEYVKWYLSEPFDVGATTYNAVDRLYRALNKHNKEASLQRAIRDIAKVNSKSQSNGWMMRATPLSVYCHKQDIDTIYKWTKSDVDLTHSNKVSLYSVVCYNIAIVHLLSNFGDYKGAYQKVKDYVEDHIKNDCEEFYNYWDQMDTTSEESELMSATINIAHIVIAMSYSFFYLKQNYTYEDAIRSILHKGGDTDTNAAIVGGLLGARWGLHNIPESWVQEGVKFKNFRHHFALLEDYNELLDMVDNLLTMIQ